MDARAELLALCERGLDWFPGPDAPTTRIPGLAMPDPSELRPAAVLVLFGVLDRVPASPADAAATVVPLDLDVLLLRRAATLGTHAGQIAFPGGRLEASDGGAVDAALREAREETGVETGGVEPLGELPPMPVPLSRHLVTPVPAWWTHESRVAAVDHDESVDVFRVPVAELLAPANRAMTVLRRDGFVHRAPAFTVGERLVWGVTALILSRMFDELGWAEPWDAGREVVPPARELSR